MFFRVILLTLSVMLFAFYANDAAAYNQGNNKLINSTQAAKIVQRKYGGKVLKVNRQKHAYKVKLVKPNGQVVTKKVNAKTGKIQNN
jgi:uncharacterized membrane protein YkoI